MGMQRLGLRRPQRGCAGSLLGSLPKVLSPWGTP